MSWFIIIFFIISIALLLITKYYLLQKELFIEQLETFENDSNTTPSDKLFKDHGIRIKYLDSIEASSLIVKNGEYFKGMNQANLSARGCVSIDELYTKYKQAFDNITDQEKLIVDTFILNLLIEIKNTSSTSSTYYNYVIKWLKTISIAKAKHWLESGMPHTLDTTIVMDSDWFINPRKTTFLHEITHIHQRQSPLDFEDLYPLLGYYYNPVDIKGLESIYPLNRNNPDGMDKYWLWKSRDNKDLITYWWIGAIFNTAIPHSLGDINMMALKLDSDSSNGSEGNDSNKIFYYLKQNPTKLSNLKEFTNFFGDNPNNYHPNEMTAKFSEWFLMEKIKGINNNNNYDYNYEGYKIYKKYFENMLNKYY